MNLLNLFANPESGSRRVASLAGVLACLAMSSGVALAQDRSSLPAYVPKPVEMPKEASYLLPDGSIFVAGADAIPEVLKSLQAMFLKHHPQFRFTVVERGNTLVPGGLSSGKSAFGPMGRNPRQPELDVFRERFGYDPTRINIGYRHYRNATREPGLWVNGENPIKELTTDQVSRIVTTGGGKSDITHWSQLGLDGLWKQMRIHLYVPRDLTGEEAYIDFLRDKMGGRPYASHVEFVDDSSDVIEALAADKFGAGIVEWWKVKDNRTKIVPVKGVDGLVSDGSEHAPQYPLTSNISIMVNKQPGKPLEPWLEEFLRMCLSRDGQEAVDRAEPGYRALNPAQVPSELAKLN